jgi:hypothetical protein
VTLSIDGSAAIMGLGYMTGTTIQTDELSPEVVANAVWAHAARTLTAHPDQWQTILEDGQSAASLVRLLAAVSVGNATGLETGAFSFRSLDGSKVRIAGTSAGNTRTVGTRDGQ